MKKQLIFVALLIVPHTVWLSEVVQGGGQGGRTTRQPLQAILEAREDEQGHDDESIFVTLKTSPPPVEIEPKKKRTRGVVKKMLDLRKKLKSSGNLSIKRHFPRETHKYFGCDLLDDGTQKYHYKHKQTGQGCFVLVKNGQVVERF